LGVKHTLIVSLVLGLVVGCHENKQAEGPMERAGKNVDHAAEKTGKALEGAADRTGEALEQAGRKLKGSDSAAPASSAAPAKKAE
jgi:hypothetical protein